MANATTITGAAATAEAVLEALGRHPGATVAELAEAAGISRSTASKALAALEAEGKVRRLPGGREGGRRRADRWEPAGRAVEPSAAEKAEAAVDPGAARLRPGALGGLVVDYLKAHAEEALGPTAVGKGLGRSQGAVANALARLAEAGTVTVVSETPRRYQLAGGAVGGVDRP
jgi:DNA-binding transcriptional ArsR family regulator